MFQIQYVTNSLITVIIRLFRENFQGLCFPLPFQMHAEMHTSGLPHKRTPYNYAGPSYTNGLLPRYIIRLPKSTRRLARKLLIPHDYREHCSLS